MASLADKASGPIVQAIDSVLDERITGLELPIINAFDPDLCPANLLPWLAYHYGVDVWSTEWSETTKRAVIKQSLTNFRRRGTRDGLIRAIGLLVSDVDVSEWFEQDPQGTPATFKVSVTGDGTATSTAAQETLAQSISRAAPHTRHWTLDVTTQLQANAVHIQHPAIATYVHVTGEVIA